MRRIIGPRILLATCALTIAAAAAGAQARKSHDPAPSQDGMPTKMMKMVRWTDVVGDWDATSLRVADDRPIATFTATFGADGKIWMRFPGRQPIPCRPVTMGGDSVTFDFGPYPSVTRPGHTATTRQTLHFTDDMMSGPFRATFDDGAILDGRAEGKRRVHAR